MPTTNAEHPLFEIVTTTAGVISIRNKVVNEIMHNPVGPWIEANRLYIDQSDLRDRIQDTSIEEFVIFDVGLGAAANSLAALHAIHEIPRERRTSIRMVSFERDLDLLRFALDHSSQFDHFHGYEETLETLLKDGIFKEDGLVWELRHGDFIELIDAEPNKANLVFFDPYSPKMNEDMWTTACFKKVRAQCCEANAGGATLYTYSRATRIRVSLIEAGFFVGQGTSTGLKDETTEAATDLKLLKSPLAQLFLERWQRSHLRYPFDCGPADEARVDQLVRDYLTKSV